MLNDFTGSMFFMASPDHFNICHMYSGLTSSVKSTGPQWWTNGASSGILLSMPVGLYSARQRAQGPLEDVGASGHPHPLTVWLKTC